MRQSKANSETHVALGLRGHSGWAAAVAVAGPLIAPRVLDRRRIELVDRKIPGAVQPYHAAKKLDARRAERFIELSRQRSQRLACEAMRAMVDSLGEQRYRLVGCGLLVGSGRLASTLAAILASHPMIHTAEGEFFRDCLRHAAASCRIPVIGIREREAYTIGEAEIGLSSSQLALKVKEIGRKIGPPWRQDEKLATLAGWVALASF